MQDFWSKSPEPKPLVRTPTTAGTIATCLMLGMLTSCSSQNTNGYGLGGPTLQIVGAALKALEEAKVDLAQPLMLQLTEARTSINVNVFLPGEIAAEIRVEIQPGSLPTVTAVNVPPKARQKGSASPLAPEIIQRLDQALKHLEDRGKMHQTHDLFLTLGRDLGRTESWLFGFHFPPYRTHKPGVLIRSTPDGKAEIVSDHL